MMKPFRKIAQTAPLLSFMLACLLDPQSASLSHQAHAQLQIVASETSAPDDADIIKSFSRQGIRINKREVSDIKENILIALDEAKKHGIGNSKVDFAAIEIAQSLELELSAGSNTVKNIVAAINDLLKLSSQKKPKTPPPSWFEYYNKTMALISDAKFNALVGKEGFSPVKISWEDIGRYENSSVGDRISDVGIWVRRNEADPQSASLAMSVRRDNNFRDKVLVVPSSKIKIHRQVNGKTQELTLTERLAQLKLSSPKRDKNVIVSNQFAVVPVPAKDMEGAWKRGVPPRAAFNFSIYPFGSTNYVITDVIEGSSEAIVGPGNHQYLYANVDGKKAPFTASRAEDRQDLLKLEAELKAQGMDVDVQRYYLIQIPLKSNSNIQLSNMGTPNMGLAYGEPVPAPTGAYSLGSSGVGSGGGGYGSGTIGQPSTVAVQEGSSQPKPTSASVPKMPKPSAAPAKEAVYDAAPSAGDDQMATAEAAKAEIATDGESAEKDAKKADPTAGLTKVAIGHGESEGDYFGGAGFENQRDDAPIRVTVVYFVTPVGNVTEKDMETFTNAFKAWDSQAIWGGSFVTKETF